MAHVGGLGKARLSKMVQPPKPSGPTSMPNERQPRIACADKEGESIPPFDRTRATRRLRGAAYWKRWASMKPIFVTTCIGVVLSGNVSAAQLPRAECPVQGELVHWIADYCMLTLETDDEIAAGDCITKELAMASKDKCNARLHYKSVMCGIVVARDGGGTIEQCVADRSFVGSAVRNDGVGARRPGPADSPHPAGSTRR